MARSSTIWERKDNGFYYTTIRGEKIKLSRDLTEAKRLFHALMAKEEQPAGTAVFISVRKLCDLFLSTECSARSTLLACPNCGVTQGYLDAHPLGRLKRGSRKRRERVLSAEERQKIRANVKQAFHDFLLGLELTGARPFSELAKITAKMVDWESRTITLREHKNDGKGSRERWT